MIQRVRIQNFKSLTDVTVDLDPLTVLIGRSGSGKTNFVQALRWLRDTLVHRNADAASQLYGGWERILSATSTRPFDLVFELTFTVPGYEKPFQYALRYEHRSAQNVPGQPFRPPTDIRLKSESLSLGELTIFCQQMGTWAIAPPLKNSPPPSGIMLGTLTGVEEATAAYLILTVGIGCYAFPDSVLTPTLNGNANQPFPGGNELPIGLKDNGSNFLETFREIHSDLRSMGFARAMATSLRSLKPHLKSVDLSLPDKNSIAVTHELNGLRLPFDLSQESEGFRRLFACFLALNHTRPKQTVIFDEPEKGIYPLGLDLLAEEFQNHADRGLGQILLTTHSPQFLDRFAPEQIRVVRMNGYSTEIGPVAPEQMEALREHFLKPGELLTVDEARMAEPSLAE